MTLESTQITDQELRDLDVSSGNLMLGPFHEDIYEPGILISMAELKDIKRVRFSRGVRGGIRLPQYLSGLWFDFYGDRSPVVLGQWIQEEDSLELAPGETIIDFQIYYLIRPGPALLKGKHPGLGITTSFGQKKTLLYIHRSLVFKLNRRVNAYQKFVRNAQLETLCQLTIFKTASLTNSSPLALAHLGLQLEFGFVGRTIRAITHPLTI